MIRLCSVHRRTLLYGATRFHFLVLSFLLGVSPPSRAYSVLTPIWCEGDDMTCDTEGLIHYPYLIWGYGAVKL